MDVSILGVRAVERSLGLSQLQESTFQFSKSIAQYTHDFLFSRVSAKVYAVDCSRVITMSWDCSTTLCSLSPERCLSLWPRLGSCCHLMQTVVGQGPSHVRAVPVPGFVRQ